jgi:hypothetical protein
VSRKEEKMEAVYCNRRRDCRDIQCRGKQKRMEAVYCNRRRGVRDRGSVYSVNRRIKHHILPGMYIGSILLNTEYKFVVFENRVFKKILVPKT